MNTMASPPLGFLRNSSPARPCDGPLRSQWCCLPRNDSMQDRIVMAIRRAWLFDGDARERHLREHALIPLGKLASRFAPACEVFVKTRSADRRIHIAESKIV